MKVTCKRCHGTFSVDDQDAERHNITCPYCDTPLLESDSGETVSETDADLSRSAETAPVESRDDWEDQSDENQIPGAAEEFLASDYRTAPLGVRLIAATFGILGVVMALFILFQVINGRITSPVLTPAYIAIGICVFITVLMYFLYHYNEVARKLTIFVCLISMLNSGRTLIQIFHLASAMPWRELINYSLRFIFSFYFMLYLMTPAVKAGFSPRKSADE